jgi:hypothetical protein
MTKPEVRMTNQSRMTNDEAVGQGYPQITQITQMVRIPASGLCLGLSLGRARHDVEAGGIVRTAAVILSAIGIIMFAGCKKNHAPDTPTVPSGPTSCAVGVSYNFSSIATDPDGDRNAIRFDWGDGDTSDWGPYFVAGDRAVMSHTWAAPGPFLLRTQSKDRDDVTSDWSFACSLVVYHEWTRTFGGAGGDEGRSVLQTQDGGFVIAGVTTSCGAGKSDVWLIKTDANGDTVWTRTFGGTLNDEGNSVDQTSDGGYVVVGYTHSFGAGGWDVWLIKTDASGDTVWTRTFGGTGEDVGKSVRQTQDGGYIVAGSTSSYVEFRGAWLVKTDANGDTVWTRTFEHGTWAECVQQRRNGHYLVAGGAASASHEDDAWLVETDADGNDYSHCTFGGVDLDFVRSVQETQDGGCILVGMTESNGAGAYDAWLVKTYSGDRVWDKIIGGQPYEEGYSVLQTQDGGYVFTGYHDVVDEHDASDVWLVRTNATGDTVWTRSFGGDDWDFGYSVQQTQDGGYIITGETKSYGAGLSDVWLIKTGPNGEMDEGGGK